MAKAAEGFLPFFEDISFEIPQLRQDPTLCLRCRSASLLCGKPVCPILVKASEYSRRRGLLTGTTLTGSSPPAVFVGRFGWPKVSVGPLVTPDLGDTLIYDSPEQWVGKDLQEIVGYRTSLIRGTSRMGVDEANNPPPYLEKLQLLSISTQTADAETTFRKTPKFRLTLSDETPPYGPSAPVEKFSLGNVKVNQHLEKLSSDIHAPARTAVSELYGTGLPVSRIERAFSAGVLGRQGRRKLVPTRWSITAVDDMLSKGNMEKVRSLPELSEWWLYSLTALGNRWFVALLPGAWRYESIEAWYPRTLWNPGGGEVLMLGDYEDFDGRWRYAGMGGCYYAARLAVTEHLLRIQRQAGVVILREIHPGQIMPLGVWNVREHVRAALQKTPDQIVDL
ncbi:MAG: Nre family DNA repair protein, partial [Candidatus Thermoplasmatota archaeon]|nr:Nre family DNA repair protein [Candidatus Thermoplasmatota archaeon]